ncbi:zinc ribbon domain-containing protein [Paenibacillus lemnae]|uniref:Zinc ribbon domain-containing protein n=1 Tax=Paenibacillus lemnae TaxID=1330551 RepID=A0A848MAS3_PAELE|nr:zinc ribbon domain-containing protein [Paenibacillus lemnae]NMO97301.1 zinc ribbon domain-containing protein [Paenibacillus lemnae]
MNILQRLKDGANRATERAQHAVEINKVNSQIAEIEHQKTAYYTDMGKVFYEGYRSQDMSIAEKEMVSLAKSCDELDEQIYSLRGRIAILKNERLCQCGRTVPLDVNFCPYCGSKQEGVKNSFQRRSVPLDKKERDDQEDVKEKLYSEEAATAQRPAPSEESYAYEPEDDTSGRNQEEAEYESFDTYDSYEHDSYRKEQEEAVRRQQDEQDRERRHLEELERERERQLELDRRIRFWQENNQEPSATAAESTVRDTVKCQICSADLPKGSKWCPRCGAEQI